MKTLCFCLALGTWSLSTLSINAATLAPATNPDVNFIATANTSTGDLTYSIAGSDIFNVFDDSSNPLGSVAAVGLSPTSILTLNIGFSEAVAVALATNVTNTTLLGNVLFVPAVGTAVTPVTDAALATLLGNSVFAFTLVGAGEGTLTFDFAGAQLASSVPEPSVAYTIGFGLCVISALRLRKRTH